MIDPKIQEFLWTMVKNARKIGNNNYYDKSWMAHDLYSGIVTPTEKRVKDSIEFLDSLTQNGTIIEIKEALKQKITV